MKARGKIINHKSKYKYIRGLQNSQTDNIRWVFTYDRLGISKCYNSEKEAALEGDKWLISLGLEPVNILIKKSEQGQKLYDVNETSKKLNICVETLSNYRKQGKITAKKIGGRIFFTEEYIQKILENK